MQTFNGSNYTKTGKSKYWYKTRWKDRSALHRDVWEFHNGPIPEGYEVHHIDHDADNNDISNLWALPKSVHASYHGEAQGRTSFPRPAVEAAKEWHKSPEGREWHRQHALKVAQQRQMRTAMCEWCSSEYQTTGVGRLRFCSGRCKQAAFRARKRSAT